MLLHLTLIFERIAIDQFVPEQPSFTIALLRSKDINQSNNKLNYLAHLYLIKKPNPTKTSLERLFTFFGVGTMTKKD